MRIRAQKQRQQTRKYADVYEEPNPQKFYHAGPGCSKLTTSLVNVSLKFQTFISQIH